MLFAVEGLGEVVKNVEDFDGYSRSFPAKVGQWLKFTGKVEKPIEHHAESNSLRVYLVNGDRRCSVFLNLEVTKVGTWVVNEADKAKAIKQNTEMLARACKALDLMDSTGKSITDSKFNAAVGKIVVVAVKHQGKNNDQGYAKISSQIWGSAASLVPVEASLMEQGDDEAGIAAFNTAKMGGAPATQRPAGFSAAGPTAAMPQGELADLPF